MKAGKEGDILKAKVVEEKGGLRICQNEEEHQRQWDENEKTREEVKLNYFNDSGQHLNVGQESDNICLSIQVAGEEENPEKVREGGGGERWEKRGRREAEKRRKGWEEGSCSRFQSFQINVQDQLPHHSSQKNYICRFPS